jgi:hypothetical protein
VARPDSFERKSTNAAIDPALVDAIVYGPGDP